MTGVLATDVVRVADAMVDEVVTGSAVFMARTNEKVLTCQLCDSYHVVHFY